jgi:hypothetical protein
MNNLLKRPDEIFELAKLYTASVATTLVYGQRVADIDSFWHKDLYALLEEVENSRAQASFSRSVC